MKLVLDQNTIQIMNMFHGITGATVMDCISENDEIYMVVAEGQFGLAVGKNGMKIKHAEKIFKKQIKLFEYSPELEKFIRNIIPGIQEMDIKDRVISVKVRQSERPRVIGKGGKNIKIINTFLEHLFDIEELKVK
jgi:N utilization substance protein A